MKKLSYHMKEMLKHYDIVDRGRAFEVFRFPKAVQRRSTAALQRRGLIFFNPLFGQFSLTIHGQEELRKLGR